MDTSQDQLWAINCTCTRSRLIICFIKEGFIKCEWTHTFLLKKGKIRYLKWLHRSTGLNVIHTLNGGWRPCLWGILGGKHTMIHYLNQCESHNHTWNCNDHQVRQKYTRESKSNVWVIQMKASRSGAAVGQSLVNFPKWSQLDYNQETSNNAPKYKSRNKVNVHKKSS